MHYIFLEDYEGLYIVRTKKFNKKVEEHLKWFLGSDYSVITVVTNPESISFVYEWLFLTKERILEELKWRYLDEDDNKEIQEKIEFLKNVLV